MKLLHRHKELLKALREIGPCTTRALADHLRWKFKDASTTRGQLFDRDIIVAYDKIQDEKANRRVFRWKVNN